MVKPCSIALRIPTEMGFVAFILFYFCCIADGLSITDYYDYNPEASVENPSWMASLNDSLLISELSIPGSHDTVSFFGGHLVQTQSWPLQGQLMAGIRFLDIRCRHFYDTLPIYHDMVYQYTYFDDVLRESQVFLQEYSTETIIMRVKGEYIATGNNETMYETVTRYLRMFPHDLFWIIDRVPTLTEARGKIVIIKDFSGPPLGLWYRDLYVEDRNHIWFFFNIDQKWNYILQHLNRLQHKADSEIYLTFTNAVGLLAYPYAVARRVNRRLYTYLENFPSTVQKLGIICMDFPGGKLIEKIIEYN